MNKVKVLELVVYFNGDISHHSILGLGASCQISSKSFVPFLSWI